MFPLAVAQRLLALTRPPGCRHSSHPSPPAPRTLPPPLGLHADCTAHVSTLPPCQVFAQYREQGVLLWRGYTLQDFSNQVRDTEGSGALGRRTKPKQRLQKGILVAQREHVNQ